MAVNISKKLTSDFLFYLAGSVVPALVSIIRLPVFTSHFSPVDFGYYSLATITFTYLAIALYSWISSCLWRYHTEYGKEGRLPVLYSNLAFLFSLSTVLVIAVTAVWAFFLRNDLMMKLIISTMVYVVVNQLVGFMLVIYRIRKMALRYNVLFSLQAMLAFGLALFLIFGRAGGIEAIPVAQATVSSVILLYLIILHRRRLACLSIRHVCRPVLKQMTEYGAVGLAVGIGVLLLSTSDRYIIALFGTMDSVGIYNQVYQLGQVSVYFLVTVYFNAINPSLIRIFSDPDRRKERITGSYIRLFLVLLLPVATYLSLFARQLSEIMLGPAFREGFPMIPFVMFSAFLYGLTLFSETRLKFQGAYRPLMVSVSAAFIMNAGLNFVLVPMFGYQAAAWTTFFSYFFLYLMLYRKDPLPYWRDWLKWPGFYRMVVLLSVQVAADLILRHALNLELGPGWTIVEGIAFTAVYLISWTSSPAS